MNRREFTGGIAAMAGGLAFGQGRAGKPNIIIFLADDLGWTDIGLHGAKTATPNIDGLARSGVEVTRCYAAPVCSPMRAGLMTGRSQVRYGVLYNVIRPASAYGLPVDEHILPQTFRGAGYQTAIIGKWHLGHRKKEFLPNSRGFDHFYGHLNGMIDYFTHMRDGGIDWQRNGKSVREEGYSTELLGAEAVRWIEGRDKSRPFFLYMPFNAPHSPLQAPEAALKKYASEPGEKRRAYMAMVDVLDQQIGKVLGCLDKNGLRENTLIVFLSDNGGPVAYGATNGTLRAGKGTVFEGGIRVPSIWNWKGRLTGGRQVAQLMSVQDVFPTLCEAAGVRAGNSKPLDGESVWGAVTSGKPRSHKEIFFGIHASEELRLGLISDPWKIVQDGAKVMLFRLDRDPNEKEDLAAKEPAKLAELKARLAYWKGLDPGNGVEHGGQPVTLPAPKDWAEAWRS